MSHHAADLGTFLNTVTVIWWASVGSEVVIKRRQHRLLRRWSEGHRREEES